MKKIVLIIILFVISISNVSALGLDCTKTVSMGDRNIDVKRVQKALNTRMNCNLEEDGIFGSKTYACVKEYQQKNNLEVDGVVGPITCNYLLGNTPVTTYNDYGITYGVVTGDRVNIRKETNTSSRILSQTTEGKLYKIESKNGNWYKITYSDNNQGYINSNYVSTNFVLVDLSLQRLYYYSNGKRLWSTSVVTGMKNSHDTPIGVYKLSKNNFSYKTVLSGYNDDGSTYNAPVDYWMPFILSSGIGFHDATWRSYSEFNKTEYLNNGSHGCVNMHHEAAEKLYNENFTAIDVIVRN